MAKTDRHNKIRARCNAKYQRSSLLQLVPCLFQPVKVPPIPTELGAGWISVVLDVAVHTTISAAVKNRTPVVRPETQHYIHILLPHLHMLPPPPPLGETATPKVIHVWQTT